MTTPVYNDYLAFWHPTRDEALNENYFPWGIVAPGSSADREFRVRNMSFNYTASGITISLTEIALEPPDLSVSAQHFLSKDGQRFTATIAIGSLGPRVVSPRYTLRRVTAPDADVAFGEFQLVATADAWT